MQEVFSETWRKRSSEIRGASGSYEDQNEVLGYEMGTLHC